LLAVFQEHSGNIPRHTWTQILTILTFLDGVRPIPEGKLGAFNTEGPLRIVCTCVAIAENRAASKRTFQLKNPYFDPKERDIFAKPEVEKFRKVVLYFT
jgi:hypothetical protein